MKKGLYTSAYFIQRAIVLHGGKYQYGKTIYESASKKVCITCPKHGDFWQTANSHLSGNGCRECANEKLSKIKTKRITVNCIVCGKEISKTYSWAQRSDRHLCSKECWSVWARQSGLFQRENNPTWKGGIPLVPCSECGKLIERDRNKIKRSQNFFCSKECGAKYKSEHKPGAGAYGKSVLVKCHTCGKEFLKEKNQVKSREFSFCDRLCWAEWRRSDAWRGKNNPTFKPELSDEERMWRSHLEPSLNIWVNKVKLRDNYTCKVCGASNKVMIAHHLNSWNKFRELRVNLDNGVCLCKKCHGKFHSVYSRGGNTQEQFSDFLIAYKNECHL